jgi:phage terminase Nu1 subunit (DNA packaging protein)
MADDSKQPPRLIVDEDWKSEAQREKQKLADQAAKAAEQKQAEKTRPIEFSDLVRMLASQAAMYLGLIPDPQTNQRLLAPEIAAVNIDMLAVLEAKTTGNLSAEEAEELAQTVVELRAVFVETTQAIRQAIADGRINADGSPGPAARGGGVPARGPVPPIIPG